MNHPPVGPEIIGAAEEATTKGAWPVFERFRGPGVTIGGPTGASLGDATVVVERGRVHVGDTRWIAPRDFVGETGDPWEFRWFAVEGCLVVEKLETPWVGADLRFGYPIRYVAVLRGRLCADCRADLVDGEVVVESRAGIRHYECPHRGPTEHDHDEQLRHLIDERVAAAIDARLSTDPWSSPGFRANEAAIKEEEAKGARMSPGTADFFGLDRPQRWGWQFISPLKAAAVLASPREVWIAAIHLAQAAGHPEVARALSKIEADLPEPDRAIPQPGSDER